MKLSDMFASLSRSAQDFEKKIDVWQADLSKKGNELAESAKKWREQAEQRQSDLNDQITKYFDDADEKVKAQWAESKAEWDKQIATLRGKAEDVRKKAVAMNAEDTADWYEAYAANMVSYAQQVQDEASNAVASAAEARVKADAAKNA